MKLSTTLRHIDAIPQSVNAQAIKEFHEYLKEIGTSENYQNQNLKQIIGFAKFLGSQKTFYDIKLKEEIVDFLNTKIKDVNEDPDKKWITTWNDYLWRLKYFYKWFHNYKIAKDKQQEPRNENLILRMKADIRATSDILNAYAVGTPMQAAFAARLKQKGLDKPDQDEAVTSQDFETT